MILYTIMPEHLIFQTDMDEYTKQKIVYYDGIPFIVQETETKEYEIVRNLSTNPFHFLEQKYAPGVRFPLSVVTS
ncbi:YlzJ-like family protein [Thermaerobacillus caldiproteolyticus]|uniref:UDP-N-acetylmuramoylalanine-D-glutamate ligase n=1 Tax=Thermaerobacillus caldiproteolyticus TaxID=247480 RepID=A0A7W0C133_9BACL|nr:YlzJ-like family protein [Anoxybacillus caldiproteolyticus]MBA2876549.1 UDP-N-acetylmuramoylalanine-D-glutamate ligase [Anoxybacillus caldiproteolyticus]QPA32106.1 YlzJ-like family protein [Anoxybacillus caldiproteolyticus]